MCLIKYIARALKSIINESPNGNHLIEFGNHRRKMRLTDRFAERYFTWGVSLSYLAGFGSMYAQISGMQGPDGILDIDSQPRYVCLPAGSYRHCASSAASVRSGLQAKQAVAR